MEERSKTPTTGTPTMAGTLAGEAVAGAAGAASGAWALDGREKLATIRKRMERRDFMV